MVAAIIASLCALAFFYESVWLVPRMGVRTTGQWCLFGALLSLGALQVDIAQRYFQGAHAHLDIILLRCVFLVCTVGFIYAVHRETASAE